MRHRLELQKKLEAILGTREVFFQPPESKKITNFPVIIYTLQQVNTTFASNKRYKIDEAYQITLITKDPETDLYEKILSAFEEDINFHILFDRLTPMNNLNHFYYTVYI